MDNNHRLIGFIRWLMISREVHKVGIEKITRQARPIGIRALEGSQADRVYRPAFHIPFYKETRRPAIVAAKVLFAPLRKFDVTIDAGTQRIIADELLESGLTCDIFTFSED